MAEKANDNKNWDAQDFARYHAGEMPAEERHALEKATLDDPFLADALEGYALTKTPVEDIRELRARLEENRGRSGPAWYKTKEVSRALRIAAVLVLFLGLAWLLRINMPGEPPPGLAGVKVIQQPSANMPPVTIDQTLQDTADTVTMEIPYSKIPKPAVVSASSKSPSGELKEEAALTDLVVVARQRDYLDTPAGNTDPISAKAELHAMEKIDLFSKEKAATAPAGISKAIEGKVAGVVIRNQNPIRGRVVDNAGNPVAFASINDRQNNLVLSADKDGYFSLNNRQNATNVKVDVNAVGFETNNIALNANTGENKIVLNESQQALSEVVVVGYGKPGRNKKVIADPPVKSAVMKNSEKLTLINLVPIAGWNRFRHFIDDSLSVNPAYFKAFNDTTIRLTFELDPSGSPKNIQLSNAAGDSAAAAGTRIAEALPPMKKIRKNAKAGLIIRF